MASIKQIWFIKIIVKKNTLHDMSVIHYIYSILNKHKLPHTFDLNMKINIVIEIMKWFRGYVPRKTAIFVNISACYYLLPT
jgi:hypothetical protein